LLFVALGVPQTLQGSVDVTTLEGAKQVISLGPVASQEAIKLIGTNGGGCHVVRNRENEVALRLRCRKWQDQNGTGSRLGVQAP